MKIKLSRSDKLRENQSVIYLIERGYNLNDLDLTSDAIKFAEKKIKSDESQIHFNLFNNWVFIQVIDEKKKGDQLSEWLRVEGFKLHKSLVKEKIKTVLLYDKTGRNDLVIALTEGLALSNYQFIKYFKDKKDKKFSLESILLSGTGLGSNEIEYLQNQLEAVYFARNLINEPLSTLNATSLADEITKIGKTGNFQVDVFGKQKIESLKMGGLLAVNKGSVDPPTFSVLEWKPGNSKNKKPIVLVGKGVVYDTGGLSLKPTKDSMDYMKSDMGGAAVVAGAILAIAKSKLPVHVVGLIPAMDNRPDGNAYVPGDIIQMGNGLNVEVLNTDAEGRMILAEALHYAKSYKPELVIDVATLTGAAAVAIGKYGIVGMGNAGKNVFNKLRKSGDKVGERIVEFPFWDEYNELLKSEVADLKNIGGRDAGAITAGKFLEHFTDYPYIHLDIAGVAFTHGEFNYKGQGGTGFGVRLLLDFIESYPWGK
ncbi:MAG: peptidase M17 [Bacteroidetes bacterium]|nr:MAG: peptidase M17 [Bacteroidota bacterium]